MLTVTVKKGVPPFAETTAINSEAKVLYPAANSLVRKADPKRVQKIPQPTFSKSIPDDIIHKLANLLEFSQQK